MHIRPRRLRRSPLMRSMVAETRLSHDMFLYPMFVTHGKGVVHEIAAMPGINHYSIDTLVAEVGLLLKLGINKVLLFGVGEEKSSDGSTSCVHHTIVADAVRELKKVFGNDIFIVTDICVCAYTTHGHCGVIVDDYVHNDASVDVLSRMALAHAEAGADMVAPSDMMDGRVAGIRDLLDSNGLTEIGIMSYSVKFASAYYGPFREAADSAPQKGDRKTYQMDFRNKRESIKEALLDVEEGADILMVKPALAYLDIISEVKQSTLLPLACYNVSGEYSMVKAASRLGMIDESKIIMENMFAFTRAGADIIITYHAKEILENRWL